MTAALLLALASGLCALSRRLDAAASAPRAAFEVSVEARVARAWRTPSGRQLELGSLRSLEPHDRALPPRVWLTLDPEVEAPELVSGTRLRARLRVAPVAGLRNPGRPRDERRLLRRGIAARARLVHPTWWVQLAPARGAVARLEAWRARLGRRLAAAGEGGALLRALGVGDASALEPRTREAFRSLGVSHLLAVSGLHLALVGGGVFALTRSGLARWAWLAAGRDPADVARALALLAAALYAGLCGFGVPVRRALVLVVAVVASTWRGRRAPRFHPIAAAALLVLALEPDALFQGGAQLSFAACMALVWGGGRRREGWTASGWRAALHGSSRAVAATAPLAAWHWGAAAPFAVLVNLLAIPWTAGVLLPAALLATAAATVPGGAAQTLIAALAWVGEASLQAGRALAGVLPGTRGVAVHVLALLAAGSLGLWAVAAHTVLRSALLAMAVGLLLRFAPPPSYGVPPPRLVAFDVGRGDAVLVQGRRGTLLVDGAAALPPRFDLGVSAVVPGLRALGVARLDRVVATHADVDHRGGLPAVVRALPVGAVWLPPGGGVDPAFAALRAAAREREVPVQEVARGAGATALGDLRVTPLWPSAENTDAKAARNERSLGLRVELGGRRVLLLGDLGEAEAALLETGDDLAADVLLLPHHGSAGSSSAALLAAVAPDVVLVSAPCPPQRGLPHPRALARARATGARLGWTGRDGAVFVGLGRELGLVPFASRRDCRTPRP